MAKYDVIYKGTNWASDHDGPNVALTVSRDEEYFQFYLGCVDADALLDLAAPGGLQPAKVGRRWYQALVAATVEAIRKDIEEGFVAAPSKSDRVKARLLRIDPARIRELERASTPLPEITDGLFGGHQLTSYQA